MKIILAPGGGKVKHARVFQIAIKWIGEKSPVPVGGRGEVGNFGEGRDFFIGW